MLRQSAVLWAISNQQKNVGSFGKLTNYGALITTQPSPPITRPYSCVDQELAERPSYFSTLPIMPSGGRAQDTDSGYF